MKDDFKIHFIQQRRPTLERYAQASSARLTVLRQAIPALDSEADQKALVAEIRSLGKKWDRETRRDGYDRVLQRRT
ncbi:MAG: hypothetical protein WCV99_06175 [Sterolibacterium sp.]|jgi:hypothetical protein